MASTHISVEPPSLPVSEGVEFRHAVGFPGYAVGNDGSIWSIRRPGGIGWEILKVTIRKSKKKNGSRPQVVLTIDGKRTLRNVHTLVLEAFTGPRPSGMMARHFPDPDVQNNRSSNLIWGTNLDNCRDREKDGNTVKGQKNGMAKLSESDVIEIRRLKSEGKATKEIAELFAINRLHVLKIIGKKHWKHI